jgi:hypothetical protein
MEKPPYLQYFIDSSPPGLTRWSMLKCCSAWIAGSSPGNDKYGAPKNQARCAIVSENRTALDALIYQRKFETL